MKAVLCRSYGKPENLTLEEIADPIPGLSQVLVEVEASAVNFPDVLMIEGNYQSQPPMPFSPGGEFSGTVTEVGADCQKFKEGDKKNLSFNLSKILKNDKLNKVEYSIEVVSIEESVKFEITDNLSIKKHNRFCFFKVYSN